MYKYACMMLCGGKIYNLLYATIYGKSAWLTLVSRLWPVRFLALWQHCAMSFGLCVRQRSRRYGSCAQNSCSACLARCFTLHLENALIASLWNGRLTLWDQNESYIDEFKKCKIELRIFGYLPLVSLLQWFGGSRLRRVETQDTTEHTCRHPDRSIFPKFPLGKDALSCCATSFFKMSLICLNTSVKASSSPDHTWPQGALHWDPGGMCWVMAQQIVLSKNRW